MLFSSVSFILFFLPCLFVVYFAVPKRHRGARNLALLLFSLGFYAFGGPRYLLLMLLSIAINYIGGLLTQGRRPKSGIVFAAVLGLGLLLWFKYAGFLAGALGAIFPSIPILDIALPIGISFYTFQGLSYVVDVYRGEAPVQKNPLKLALYIALFPQLVAGPIVRYSTVAHEIDTRHENVTDFGEGATRFMLGFGKKMLLANTAAEIADAVFAGAPGSLSVTTAWVGALAYMAQIYLDFSAYSDMAIGLGRIFGFHFLENFNYPYIARSVSDFWRRWHISLSTWFRDYVYIPLGGNRCGQGRHIRNIAIVWLLTGFWHGAAWNFIFWGAWFLLLLLGEKYLWGGALERLPAVLRHLYTLLAVILSWVLFRAEGLSHAAGYLGAMFGLGGGGLWGRETVYYLLEYWPEWLLFIPACLPIAAWLRRALSRGEGRLPRFLLDYGSRAFALFAFALGYIKLVTGSFNPFIYFRF